jgi:hypothetical protein
MTQIPNEVNVIEGRVVHKKVERVASFSKTCGRAICRRVQGENDKAEKRLGVTDGFGEAFGRVDVIRRVGVGGAPHGLWTV